MTDRRRARAETLARELNIDVEDLPKLLDQYAATATQATDSDAMGYLQTFPTVEDACSELGGGVLEGYLPAGVYDLDTGELIELHVSTPVVTRSEDQGIARNPLLRPQWRGHHRQPPQHPGVGRLAMRTYERIEASQIQVGDRVARARNHQFFRVVGVSAGEKAVRLLCHDGGSVRPRKTALWWRIINTERDTGKWTLIIEGIAPWQEKYVAGAVTFKVMRDGVVAILRAALGSQLDSDSEDFDNEVFETVEYMAETAGDDDYEYAKNDLYDWADRNGVWIDPLR